MFRDKDFNVAFLISLSWHLFLMLFVTIVVLPTSLEMAKTSTVSFLGPLLEKTAFELMLEQGAVPKRVLFQQPMYFNNSLLAYSETGLNELKFDSLFFTGEKEGTKISSKDLFEDFKFVPSSPFLNAKDAMGKERTASSDGQKDFFIEGPLAKREILFRPEPPVVPKRLEGNQTSFIVEVKFKLLPDGKVGEVDLLASSGYPDIDLAAINHIKAFKFLSLSSGELEKPQWGKIRLTLKSK